MEQNTTNNVEEGEKEIKKHYMVLKDKYSLIRTCCFMAAGALIGIVSCLGSLVKIVSVTREYEKNAPIVRTYLQTQHVLRSLNGRVKLESSHVVEYVVPEAIQKELDEVLGQQHTANRSLDDVIMQVEQKLAGMKNIEVIAEYQKRIDRIYQYGTNGGNAALAVMALSLLFLSYSVVINRKKDAEIVALTNP